MSMAAPWRRVPTTSVPTPAPDRATALGYARAYAKLGWRVLPLHSIVDGACSCGTQCDSPGKHPRTAHGVTDGTTDNDTITRWWRRWPTANIGVVCGRVSGIFALDIDPRNGGDASFDILESDIGALPASVEALTGGGGRHLLYEYPHAATIRKRAHKLGAGLDVISDGGYIVVEPSNHASGTAYTWEGSSDPLEGIAPAAAPGALLARVCDTAPADSGNMHTGAPMSSRTHAELLDALPLLDADDRDNWVAVGMALHSTGAPEAFSLWDEWSARSDKYRAGETARLWAGFKPAGGVTLDSVFRQALDNGYKPRADLPSMFAPERASDQAHPVIKLATVAELLSRPRPLWTVDELIPEQGVGMIFGPPGAGKTFVTLDLCMAIVRGKNWFGRRVKPGAVVYVAAEGNVRDRVDAYMRYHRLDADALADFRVVESPLNLLQAITAEQLSDALAQTFDGRERVLVFDTLNRSIGGGEENSGEDMAILLDAAALLARRHQVTVIFIHHPGKDAARGARGHSSLLGAVDFEIQLLRDGDERVIHVTKQRESTDDYALGAFQLPYIQLGFKRDYDPDAGADESFGSCIVQPVEIPTGLPTPKKLPHSARRAFDALHRALSDKERRTTLPEHYATDAVNPPKPGQWVVRESDWRHHIDLLGGITSSDSASAKRMAFMRARDRIEQSNLIELCAEFTWLKGKL